MQKAQTSEQVVKNGLLFSGGLITVSLIIVQNLISPGISDLSTLISLCAFVIALPLLGGWFVIFLKISEIKYHYSSKLYTLILYLRGVGTLSALIGIDAAFWHTSWLVGTLFLVTVVFSILVYFTYLVRLEELESNLKKISMGKPAK